MHWARVLDVAGDIGVGRACVFVMSVMPVIVMFVMVHGTLLSAMNDPYISTGFPFLKKF
jgi:hypothetical protein